jgi:hypothetical protein
VLLAKGLFLEAGTARGLRQHFEQLRRDGLGIGINGAEPDQMMAFLRCWPADELMAEEAPLVRRFEALASPQRVLF